MITADALARELGCTLSDLASAVVAFHPETTFTEDLANAIRASWSERTGIDYTENDLIRATTLEHRVQSVRAEVDFYVLECTCGHRLTSNSIMPEAAK